MIAGIVRKLPVLKLSVAVLNNLGADLPAEKVVERFCLLGVAEENNDGSIAFNGARANRLLDAVADARECQLFRAYLRVTRDGQQQETDDQCQFSHKLYSN